MIQYVVTPLNAGICAAVTFGSGSAAMINEATPITLGIFITGVAAIVGVAVWLGKIAVNLAIRMEQGNARMERLEQRVDSLETTIRAKG